MVDLTDDIRSFLKKKRAENGWSLRDLEKRVGISNTAISNIETGKTEQIHRSVLARFFRAFGESKTIPAPASVQIDAVERITELAIDIPPENRLLAIALLEKLVRKP